MDLGYDQRELLALHSERLKELHTHELDFDDLVQEIDQCREAKVAKQRKKAGFSTEELENFKSLFEMFDKDSSSHIDNNELIALLKFFNWQPRTKEGQQVLMEKLDIARARAREAGIEDVGEYGSCDVKFWTFVQLARMLKRETEQAEEQMNAEVVKELNLSDKECEQFRGIFQGAITREKEKAKEAGLQAMSERVPEYGLKGEAVRTLVRSLGVQLTTRVDDKLADKLADLEEEDRVLTFVGFLRLMVWMVETNFAGINDAAAKYA
uniref:EF-hand domain-containing protein n=1 Tax=Alexandrium catenella TaxID=2925 RepID=A0A7S1RME9_ALECA|mmetsp:Transcript_62873/g.167913  ORF Transcript_62873/g.167913 Transcript_62873/m.167913 type:complete len:267 (+) Transcript_62873:2-802(+)